MKRGVKIALIITVVVIILIAIAIPLYYSFTSKTIYHISGVEKTEFTTSDFVDKSELKLYKNGTFHIVIEHKEKGLSLVGIGTYQNDGKEYQLKFEKLFARDNDSNVVDYTTNEHKTERDAISCTRSGNRIKFIDHKAQTFYFG